ncbi:AaceriAER278Wp [[Ashbya] aceris (nom. inval.)]|nr:AaceriAER278Wp [[Ashbya] aceris (nom. inval.)]
MPPKVYNSNSESESKTRGASAHHSGAVAPGGAANTRSNGKQRLTVAQQQYLKELVRTHIHNNHEENIPLLHPLDFEAYSDDFLRRYKDHYQIPLQDNLSLQGFLLGSELGSRTYSYRRNLPSQPDSRVTKKQLADEVRRHFTASTVKETECIPAFIYKVKNSKKKFRMEFRS